LPSSSPVTATSRSACAAPGRPRRQRPDGSRRRST